MLTCMRGGEVRTSNSIVVILVETTDIIPTISTNVSITHTRTTITATTTTSAPTQLFATIISGQAFQTMSLGLCCEHGASI